MLTRESFGLKIGDLVCSTSFQGVGKVISEPTTTGQVAIGFFESPLRPEARVTFLPIAKLEPAELFPEAVVYCKGKHSNLWRRARYIGEVEPGQHLVVFRQEESANCEWAELYCLNLGEIGSLAPQDFLATRSNDAPFFVAKRTDFAAAYIEQRSACRSISSLPSSSVELEAHQLAVVRRVLQDQVPRYLLADEVGLGKTIEAGMIIREHLLEYKRLARVVVAVPEALVEQWRTELTLKFHLGELLVGTEDGDALIEICAHTGLPQALQNGHPTLLAVDEAHLVAPWAWSNLPSEKRRFETFAQCAAQAKAVILLSGTPLSGNEKNFLAMLHLLSPEAYRLGPEGIDQFLTRLAEREKIGGLYAALTPENSNAAIRTVLRRLLDLGLPDPDLITHIEHLQPLVEMLAPPEGEAKQAGIRNLRAYLGNHYRLHQRVLRNRRDDKDLATLFPGLAGLSRCHWCPNDAEPTVDEVLEDYRFATLRAPDKFSVLNADTYLAWVDDLLTAPIRVADRARTALHQPGLNPLEISYLRRLEIAGRTEQNHKDQTLLDELKAWLSAHAEGKAVVFCNDPSVADRVHGFLAKALGTRVERHRPPVFPEFVKPGHEIRVLVCDQTGEDGLNLHGKSRLAVHYGLSRSISRFEQRLGRMNRYFDSTVKGVRRVENLALLPERPGVLQQWLDALEGVIGVFSQTVASLQYVLEEEVGRIWAAAYQDGEEAFNEGSARLSGDQGLLAIERKKVQAQEGLLSMEEEVREAREFAHQLAEADEKGEQEWDKMDPWIRDALDFGKEKVELQTRPLGTPDPAAGMPVRYLFKRPKQGPRTLVDAKTFVHNCITGIDRSAFPLIRTRPMSASRALLLRNPGVYPLRYGQPFIDAIWDMLQSDSRGATSAILRRFNRDIEREPKAFFKMEWLVSACGPGVARHEQRKADERHPPQIITQWLGEDGRPPVAAELKRVTLRYDKQGTNAIGYRDCNLRPAGWAAISQGQDAEHWSRTVLEVAGLGQRQAMANCPLIEGGLHLQLLSMSAVILCSDAVLTQALAEQA